jgi:hypothetical protein
VVLSLSYARWRGVPGNGVEGPGKSIKNNPKSGAGCLVKGTLAYL